MVTLKDYVSRMKENQKDIYYITGKFLSSAEADFVGASLVTEYAVRLGWVTFPNVQMYNLSDIYVIISP